MEHLRTQAEFVSSERKPLRIALTISGAVALGAYEGGALAALLIAVQRACTHEGGWLRIDAMGGASAGAITALLAARTLHTGRDPIEVMERAWVTESSMANLLGKDLRAPLSVDGLRRTAEELLRPPPPGAERGRQSSPICVEMALASLRGLTYEIGRLREQDGAVAPITPIESYTHLDWGSFTLDPSDTEEQYTQPAELSPMDFALASGANAFGFPPKLLDRTARDDLERLANHPIINFPASGTIWYTDGGTIDNEPLGRTLDLANEIDAGDTSEFNRLHLLIHPHPTAPPPSDDPAFSLRDQQPSWVSTAATAFELRGSQGIYDDLRRVEKTNSRIIWKNDLLATLKTLLNDASNGPEITALLERIEGQKADIQESINGTSRRRAAPDALSRVLELVTGISGKSLVLVDAVSPTLLRERYRGPIEDLLAGEFLMHFGGFLDEDLRGSDFALGYLSMLTWLERDLPGYIDETVAASSIAAVKEHEALFTQRFADGRRGRTELTSLPKPARRMFRKTLDRVATVSLNDVTPKVARGTLRTALWAVARPILRRAIPWGIARMVGGRRNRPA